MIKRIKADLVEGDIVELAGISEPLYIFHGGRLTEITPMEYNLCVEKAPEERWFPIYISRCNSSKKVG